ncbi:TPA: hypothetical protein ACIVS6_003060, partial [Salmonella enterica subsp. enterica serovar Waycross]|nr:hypothetical protein [Salmonella enterica subsp. enterica serovar Minnesota]
LRYISDALTPLSIDLNLQKDFFLTISSNTKALVRHKKQRVIRRENQTFTYAHKKEYGYGNSSLTMNGKARLRILP